MLPAIIAGAGLLLSAIGSINESMGQNKLMRYQQDQNDKELALKQKELEQSITASNRQADLAEKNMNIGRFSALKTMRDDWRNQRYNSAMYNILSGAPMPGQQNKQPNLYQSRYNNG